MRGLLPVLLMAVLLNAGTALGAQARRRRRSAPARTSTIALDRLLQTAAADQRDHAFTSAERAYASALQLDPGNAAARAGLVLAQDGACHAAVALALAGAQWAPAAARLQACATQDSTALARIEQLAAIQAALTRAAWTPAATAMQQLAAAALPAALAAPPGSLAPAYAAFGAGRPRAAARLSATLAAAHPGPGQAAQLARFDAFLRNRARRRAWHAAAWPLLAAYLLALGGSLFWGLRRLSEEEAPAASGVEATGGTA